MIPNQANKRDTTVPIFSTLLELIAYLVDPLQPADGPHGHRIFRDLLFARGAARQRSEDHPWRKADGPRVQLITVQRKAHAEAIGP